MNKSIFLGQPQSTTGERVDVLLHGTSVVFDVIAVSEFSKARTGSGFGISVDQADILRGLLLNARARVPR